MGITISFYGFSKVKIYCFLPTVLECLEIGGIVVLDDVFQGGDIAKSIEEVHRGQRTIYRGLQKLFDATLKHPDLTASLLPLGDGLLLIRKTAKRLV